MKGGSPASERVNALYSKDCLTNHTNELDLSAYNKSPKALLSNVYGASYATTGGGVKKPRKSRKMRRSRRVGRKSKKSRKHSKKRSMANLSPSSLPGQLSTI